MPASPAAKRVWVSSCQSQNKPWCLLVPTPNTIAPCCLRAALWRWFQSTTRCKVSAVACSTAGQRTCVCCLGDEGYRASRPDCLRPRVVSCSPVVYLSVLYHTQAFWQCGCCMCGSVGRGREPLGSPVSSMRVRRRGCAAVRCCLFVIVSLVHE